MDFVKLVYAIILIGFISCDQDPIPFELISNQSGAHKVLIEEFTGVRCPNCPSGTEELEALRAGSEDRVIIVSIHAGFFAFPYENSQFNFNNEQANTLLSNFREPLGYPSAVINRFVEPISDSYQISTLQWASIIGQELAKDAVLALSLERTFNADTRELEVQLNVRVLAAVEAPMYAHFYILEDNLFDPQADNTSSEEVVESYRHRHTFRAAINDLAGDLLVNSASENERFQQSVAFTVPERSEWWKTENLRIVAFVTQENGTPQRVVLEAEEIMLLP